MKKPIDRARLIEVVNDMNSKIESAPLEHVTPEKRKDLLHAVYLRRLALHALEHAK